MSSPLCYVWLRPLVVTLSVRRVVYILILTHVTHNNQPYDELEAFASEFEGVTLAYDGMVVNV